MNLQRPGLDASHLQRVEALFEQALEMPTAQQESWLRQACGGDSHLFDTLLEMLRFEQDGGTDLGRSVGRIADAAAEPRDRSGERIGRYRLQSRIRYGGMAEVYAAIRDDGEFAHEVALKIVRSDRRSPLGMANLFKAERGVLARLRHPNICQIFDGGTTDQGESWFVMEHLQGEPLLAACRQRALSWDIVLGYFLDLCAAVAHTHRQLIIHRDIKPDNVLLAEAPQGSCVKLLDFGIAGSLDAGNTDEPHGGSWHSASHAAPEVIAGETGGVGADVYSLGRLLGEMAVHFPGSRRREVEMIAAHASQSDAQARYADVELLSNDLRRLRDRQPISLLSHRPTHVAWRFLQRHVMLLLGSAALLIAAIAFLQNEQQLRREAETATAMAVAQRDQAKRIRDFLLEAYQSADPASNAGEDLRVSELLERQLAALVEHDDLEPAVRSELLGTLGQALLGLGRYAQASEALELAARLALEAGSPYARLWAGHMILLGQSAGRSGHSTEAEAAFREVESQRHTWESSAEALWVELQLYSSWGPLAYRLGQMDDAERLIRKGLRAQELWTESAGVPAGRAALLVTLGAVQSARFDLAGALQTFERGYALNLSDGHQFSFDHLALLGWIGITLDKLGRPEAAEPYLKEAIDVAERLFPQPHPKLGGAYGNLGAMYLQNGRLAEARPVLQRGMEVMQAFGDRSSIAYLSRLRDLGLLALEHEDLVAGRLLLQESLVLHRDSLGEMHLRTARAQNALAALSLLDGRYPDALADALHAAAVFETSGSRADPGLMAALHSAAVAQAELGDGRAARATLELAHALMASHADDDRVLANAYLARAKVLRVLGEIDAAGAAFDQARQRYESAYPNGHAGRARAQVGLAEICVLRGDLDGARGHLAASELLLEDTLAAAGPTRQTWLRLAAQVR